MGFKFNPLYGTLDIAGSGGSGGGDVVGNGASTDNAIARYDGTTGKVIQNSAITIDDSGNMAGVGTINTLSLPTSNIVGINDSQTLTNKTLTAPIISTISNTGTLTLPTSTDTLVGRATTDTLTNKTITATSNTLGGVTMGLGSDATGDIYYRNSSGYLTRLGIGSTADVLTVSAGVPSWAAPSSGSSTPKFNLVMMDGYDPTTSGNATQVFGGGASTGSWTKGRGRSMNTTTAANSYNGLWWSETMDSGYFAGSSSFYSKSFTIMAQVIHHFENDSGRFFVGVGGSGTTTIPSTASKKIGFKFVRSGGVSTWYAITGDGTSETATDITSTVTGTTGYSMSSFRASQIMVIEWTTGTSAKFYYNGTLCTTITTNLPSGALSDASCAIGAINFQDGTTSGNFLTMNKLILQYNAY